MTDMEATLKKLYEHETLSRDKAFALLLEIMSGTCSEARIAAFLSIFAMRKLTVAELLGFQDAMLSCCNKVTLADGNTLDIVGTGGDGKNTFNISTTAAIVTAGAGIKVAKHGNYGASSMCGSSDVLSYLGYKFTSDPQVLNRQLDTANLCFLHGPLFHPVMRHVAVARRNLGMRTFFNLLGPIVNPAAPATQFLGVTNLSNMRLYQYLLQEQEIKQYGIISALDGYDEISLTGSFKLITPLKESILKPEDIGMTSIAPKALSGGSSVQESAEILLNILQGKGTAAQNDVVIANSAFAIQATKPVSNIADCVEMARASLSSGEAYRIFSKIINE
jgi:anthranilate phosphoribosyltransferase